MNPTAIVIHQSLNKIKSFRSLLRRQIARCHTRVLILFIVMIGLGSAFEVRPQEFELVHFGDLIDVDVVGTTEFDWRGRLSSEGTLEGFDSYGDPIVGLCRSEASIAADVKSSLSKFLRDPVVSVRVIDRSGRQTVVLDGAVRTSHRFQLNRPAKLRELIVLAGGIRDDASGEIQIFRPANLNCEAPRSNSTSGESNPLAVLNITIKDLIAGDPAANPVIRSGDIVNVRRADVVYVIGGVVNPRQVSSRSTTTLSRAIAASGGLTKQADRKAITIFRREGNETKRLEFDFDRINSGESADPVLVAFDIVEVGVSGSERSKFAPMIAAQPNNNLSVPLRIVE